MTKRIDHLFLLCLCLFSPLVCEAQSVADLSPAVALFPANNAVDVNPDTDLELTFSTAPAAGKSGLIRIYDASSDQLIDTLDMSIPPGPTATIQTPDAIYTPTPYPYVAGHFTNANTKPGTPSGGALAEAGKYQLTIIGGFTDAFHFYPIIIHDKKATLYPHNNLLQYGKSYYVTIERGVLSQGDKAYELADKTSWRFTTKKSPPATNAKTLTVSADGSGDFNTVQGAIDFVPDANPSPVTIFIKNGMYEEIVYFRNKSNITLLGEDREKVVVFYNNNEIFNPHPVNIKTNEVPGSFPSRRAAFAVDNSSKINLVNLTIKTTAYGQAEGLLLNGKEIIVSDVTVVGSGDALQSNGSVYYSNCKIVGDGDSILGRGPAFFNHCEFSSQGPFMWIRNTAENHGNVFVNSTFTTRGDKPTVLARAPTNGGKNYPYVEAVLIDSTLSGIDVAGWGEVGGDTSNVHYWEYNSVNPVDGQPLDIRGRHPASRQLVKPKDAELIRNYRNPAFVLGGWNPAMAPLILAQPQSVTVAKAQTVTLQIKAAAVPEPLYQWSKGGKFLSGATQASLVIKDVSEKDAGSYSVRITNSYGNVVSSEAVLKLKGQ